MVQVGFRGKFEHAASSLHNICKHEEVVLASISCEDPADCLAAARIIKCLILMADCNPERIVFMKHM